MLTNRKDTQMAPENGTLIPAHESIEDAIKEAQRDASARAFTQAEPSSWARIAMLTDRAARAAAPPQLRLGTPLRPLAYTARLAVLWAQDVRGDAATELDVWEEVRAELDRAHRKHDGMTPLHPDMRDMDRAVILLEEVGEVARALTPDAHTSTGHAGDLADELIQVAAMATAWLARVLIDHGRGGAR